MLEVHHRRLSCQRRCKTAGRVVWERLGGRVC
nr:MAG TPA: hypothetical protein [Bacteriophage sp.]